MYSCVQFIGNYNDINRKQACIIHPVLLCVLQCFVTTVYTSDSKAQPKQFEQLLTTACRTAHFMSKVSC